MSCKNIAIDLDEKIEQFCEKELNQDIQIKDYIKKIVESAVEIESLNLNEICVSISSATKEEIKNINNKYRGIDRITDVLSFPIFSKEELDDIRKQKDSNKKIKSLELGDIIICLDVVKVQAIEYETGLKRELLYMITHGICHLLGYDHIVTEDKEKMRKIEEEILGKIGVKK